MYVYPLYAWDEGREAACGVRRTLVRARGSSGMEERLQQRNRRMMNEDGMLLGC